MNLAERARRTQKTVDKYKQRPFDWHGATCVHLARTQLRNMGHKPPRMPPFRSPVGARRALIEMGVDSISDLLDQMLPRIVPAQTWVGDLIALPGDDSPFEAIVIADGAGGCLGFHAGTTDAGLFLINDALSHATGAWRL